MAHCGTPTVCELAQNCRAALTLEHKTTARIATSHEFSCPVHGWIGFYVPETELVTARSIAGGASARPIPDSIFTFEELTVLVELARVGAAYGSSVLKLPAALTASRHDALIERLERRLAIAAKWEAGAAVES